MARLQLLAGAALLSSALGEAFNVNFTVHGKRGYEELVQPLLQQDHFVLGWISSSARRPVSLDAKFVDSGELKGAENHHDHFEKVFTRLAKRLQGSNTRLIELVVEPNDFPWVARTFPAEILPAVFQAGCGKKGKCDHEPRPVGVQRDETEQMQDMLAQTLGSGQDDYSFMLNTALKLQAKDCQPKTWVDCTPAEKKFLARFKGKSQDKIRAEYQRMTENIEKEPARVLKPINEVKKQLVELGQTFKKGQGFAKLRSDYNWDRERIIRSRNMIELIQRKRANVTGLAVDPIFGDLEHAKKKSDEVLQSLFAERDEEDGPEPDDEQEGGEERQPEDSEKVEL